MADETPMKWNEIYTYAREANRVARAFQHLEEACASAVKMGDEINRLQRQVDELVRSVQDMQITYNDAKVEYETYKSYVDKQKAELDAELKYAIDEVDTARKYAKSEVDQITKDLKAQRSAAEAELVALQGSYAKSVEQVKAEKQAALDALFEEEATVKSRIDQFKNDLSRLVKSVQ